MVHPLSKKDVLPSPSQLFYLIKRGIQPNTAAGILPEAVPPPCLRL